MREWDSIHDWSDQCQGRRSGDVNLRIGMSWVDWGADGKNVTCQLFLKRKEQVTKCNCPEIDDPRQVIVESFCASTAELYDITVCMSPVTWHFSIGCQHRIDTKVITVHSVAVSITPRSHMSNLPKPPPTAETQSVTSSVNKQTNRIDYFDKMLDGRISLTNNTSNHRASNYNCNLNCCSRALLDQ